MAFNFDKAFEVDEDGYAITDDDGNVLAYLCAGSGDPDGSSAPINTWYFRTDNNLLYYKFGAGVNDWRQITAEDIAFDNTNLKFNASDAFNAIKEIRDDTVFAIDNLISSLNGNHNITVSDSNIHLVSGTATGYSVTLPDATLLFKGRRFEITNSSTETIEIRDNSGFALANLIVGDTIILTLDQNLTAAGVWVAVTVTSSATGIVSYNVTDQILFTTTSAVDAILTGMTVTPVAGRYAAFFSADITITQNNRVAECVVYEGGVALEDSRRRTQGVGANFNGAFNTLTEVSVNGAQAVDIRVNVTSGSLDVTGRTLLLIRLGGQ